MMRYFKQFVLYLATAVIMGMTLLAILAWHVFKGGYQMTRLWKRSRPCSGAHCRKIVAVPEKSPSPVPAEEFEPSMLSASEKA